MNYQYLSEDCERCDYERCTHERCTHEHIINIGRRLECSHCKMRFYEESPIDVDGLRDLLENYDDDIGELVRDRWIANEIHRMAEEELKALIESRKCKHPHATKLPYSGELCKSCMSIIIDNDFNKHLTRQSFNDIMKVLADNYDGDVETNPHWVKSFTFINVDDEEEPPRQRCRHPKREDLNGTSTCMSCGEVSDLLTHTTTGLDFADSYTMRQSSGSDPAVKEVKAKAKAAKAKAVAEVRARAKEAKAKANEDKVRAKAEVKAVKARAKEAVAEARARARAKEAKTQ